MKGCKRLKDYHSIPRNRQDAATWKYFLCVNMSPWTYTCGDMFQAAPFYTCVQSVHAATSTEDRSIILFSSFEFEVQSYNANKFRITMCKPEKVENKLKMRKSYSPPFSRSGHMDVISFPLPFFRAAYFASASHDPPPTQILCLVCGGLLCQRCFVSVKFPHRNTYAVSRFVSPDLSFAPRRSVLTASFRAHVRLCL